MFIRSVCTRRICSGSACMKNTGFASSGDAGYIDTSKDLRIHLQ